MLSARRNPTACHACRTHLLRIFQFGFVANQQDVPAARRHAAYTSVNPRHNTWTSRRLFTTVHARHQENVSHHARPVEEHPPEDIESVVRRAKKTFGDTLPRDYLSPEEYSLYERLYGPPIRETKGHDLDALIGAKDARPGGTAHLDDGSAMGEDPGGDMRRQGRNILIREDEYGNQEEIEYDTHLGNTVTPHGTRYNPPDEGYSTGIVGQLDADAADGPSHEHMSLGPEESTPLRIHEQEALQEARTYPDADKADQELEYRELESDPDLDIPFDHDHLIANDVGPVVDLQDLDSDRGDLQDSEVELELASPSDLELATSDDYDDTSLRTYALEPMVHAEKRPQREREALLKLQKEHDAYIASRPAASELDVPNDAEHDVYDESLEDPVEQDEDELEEYPSSRLHPHTVTGRATTKPATLGLPKEFLGSILEQVKVLHPKQLQIAAENALGGPRLPHSPSTAIFSSRPQQLPIALNPASRAMSENEANAYLAAVMPPVYVMSIHILTEVRKRLGRDWLRQFIDRKDGSEISILDAGGGGAAACAWRDIVQAEWDVMVDEGLAKQGRAPKGKMTVLAAPDSLRHKASRFIENTTFLPRLPDYFHVMDNPDHMGGVSSQAQKSFDVIIAPHTLWPLKENHRRKHMVLNLWKMLNPDGGILILAEKGVPRGFEAIAGARDLLLDHHLSSSKKAEMLAKSQEQPSGGMIIAPCTNHSACPMYPVPGLSNGRKDFCHFYQRYHRPNFLQRIMGASASNHEDIKFSYLAVQKGKDLRQSEVGIMQGEEATLRALKGYEHTDLPGQWDYPDSVSPSERFHALSLPRNILPPIKRHGHVTLDLCTPSGTLERWTVPKSFSRLAYHDARKAKWGDLWALGAKTRVHRTPRLGRTSDQAAQKAMARLKDNKRKGVRSQGFMGPKERIAGPHTTRVNVLMAQGRGFQGLEQQADQAKYLGAPERRTRGGRTRKLRTRAISEEEDRIGGHLP